jgi:protoporphyrinogen oxidase
LIEAFDYPRLGPGQMWETVARRVSEQGAELRLGTDVAAIFWKPGRVTGILTDKEGRSEEIDGSHFVSSMPIRDLLQRFAPAVPDRVLKAATKLNYRDFLTVALVVRQPDLFPDNWLYVHDPGVKLGRIQNFMNWSPDMVPDQQKTCLGLEYFCFEGDGLWSMSDRELIELGTRELEMLGLAKASDIEDGAVVRMQKAYPVYDSGYEEALRVVRGFTDRLENLQLVGRNGMHKYNNQDHSMLTAMLAVKNILGGKHDLWGVNADQDYHEEVTGHERGVDDLAQVVSTQPRVPRQLDRSTPL